MTIPAFDDLTLARRATNYAALPDAVRRERIHIAAWRAVCWAQARRFVCEASSIAPPTNSAPGWGRSYGEKLSKHPASDDTKGIDY